MKKSDQKFIILIGILLMIIAGLGYLIYQKNQPLVLSLNLTKHSTKVSNSEEIKLPSPVLKSDVSIEEAIENRRSIRNYSKKPLALKEIGQLLWAAQGITEGDKRAAPSAGALYPLEVYILGEIEGLDSGMYHYNPENHSLNKVSEIDPRAELAQASYNQIWISEAPVNIIFMAVYERTTKKYGQKGIRYVYMEVGHAAQNVYLQAESLGLGTVTVGGFDDQKVKEILNLPSDQEPLYIMPVGYLPAPAGKK